jgi:hypothetical protein
VAVPQHPNKGAGTNRTDSACIVLTHEPLLDRNGSILSGMPANAIKNGGAGVSLVLYFASNSHYGLLPLFNPNGIEIIQPGVAKLPQVKTAFFPPNPERIE